MSLPESRIAIVGIACQMPAPAGSETHLNKEQFWQHLKEGGHSPFPISSERFAGTSWVGDAAGQLCSDVTGQIPHPWHFDHKAFGISSAEARWMSAPARKLLEVAFEALADSGVNYRGSDTGVFVGSGQSWENEVAELPYVANEYLQTGRVSSTLANRLSYVFDLRGPSLALDTACSATLYATHLAIRSILDGDCSQALVAGSNLVLRLEDSMGFSALGVLSKSGCCSALSDQADGYIRADGNVAIVIKPYDQAVADGDYIYGCLLGTAVNSNGRSANSMASPSAASQMRVIERAWARAQRSPSDVDYVELHATGTTVGDSIEANAAGQVFSRGRTARPLLVGSVKANVGHTEFTAFLTSLVKCCSILQSGRVPRQIHCSQLSRKVDWKKYNMGVAGPDSQLEKDNKELALIGITSSGFGGANGHAVLEEAPAVQTRAPAFNMKAGDPKLWCVGLLQRDDLKDYVNALQGCTSEDSSQLVHVLARRARQMPWRTFAVASDPIEESRFPEPKLVSATSQNKKTLFVFAGQGAQHLHMGKSLYARSTVFRSSIDRADRVFRDMTGRSLLLDEGLFASEAQRTKVEMSGSIDVILPAIAAIQLALFDLLASLNVKPDVVMGHSAGEISAMYASGALTFEHAMAVAVARSKALRACEAMNSTMAAIHCKRETLDELLKGVRSRHPTAILDVGAFNSAQAFLVSGHRPAVEALVAAAVDRKLFARGLPTKVGVHSGIVESCRKEYREGVDQVMGSLRAVPHIPFISTCHRRKFVKDFTAEYIWQNGRGAVYFQEGLKLFEETYGRGNIVVEISAHPALATYISETLPDSTVATALRRSRAHKVQSSCEKEELQSFLSLLGTLLVTGKNDLRTEGLFPAVEGCLKFPEYPFRRTYDRPVLKREDLAKINRTKRLALQHDNHLLRLSARTHPDLADHRINGASIMPASGFIEMAMTSGTEHATVLREVVFQEALSLGDDPLPLVVKSTCSDDGHWTCISENVRDGKIRVHSSAIDARNEEMQAHAPLDWEDLKKCCPTHIADKRDILNLAPVLKNFGPTFQRIDELWKSEDEIVLRIDASVRGTARKYTIHPAIVDAALQGAGILTLTAAEQLTATHYYLPSKVALVRSWADQNELLFAGHEILLAYVKKTSWSPDEVIFDLVVGLETGQVMIELVGLALQRHPNFPVVRPSTRYTVIDQPVSFAIEPLWEKGEKPALQASISRDLFHLLDRKAACFLRDAQKDRDGVIPADLSIDRRRYTDFAVRNAAPAMETLTTDLTSLQTYDAFATFDAVTNRAARTLPASFHDDQAIIRELFSDDCMTQFYHELGRMDNSFDMIPEIFLELVRRLVNSGKRVIRVLEVGAGTGAMTRAYANAWAQRTEMHDVHVEFVITDISRTLAKEAAASIPQGLCVSTDDLDLSAPSVELDSAKSGFDIVLMFDVLHVVPEIQPALKNLSSLLVEGGYLYLVDMDGGKFKNNAPGTLWMNFVLAFKEWWAFQDERQHCTLGPEEWSVQLERAGFTAPSIARLADDQLGHLTIVTQALRSATGPPTTVAMGKALHFHFTAGDEIKLLDYLKPHMEASMDVFITASSHAKDASICGLTRAIRNEQPKWRIFLLLGGNSQAITKWMAAPREPEMTFDVSSSRFTVPRLLPLASPGYPDGSPLLGSLRPYLIVGGIGGIGLRLALWLRDNGAKHVVLTSRSGPDSFSRPENQAEKQLHDYLYRLPGFRIELVASDCAHRQSVEQLCGRLGPLAGVFHLATTLCDASASSQTSETFRQPFSAKVEGLKLLLQQLTVAQADFVLGASSLAAMIGSSGQSNYSAACTAMEALLDQQPNGISLQIPAVLDGGMFLRTLQNTDGGARAGVLAIGKKFGITLDCLFEQIRDALLLQREHISKHVYVPEVDLAQLHAAMPGRECLLQHLILRNDSAKSEGQSDFRTPADIVSDVLDIDASQLGKDIPLTAFGLDSLVAVRLSASLSKNFQREISQLQLLGGVTIDDIEKLVAQEAAEEAPQLPHTSNEHASAPIERLNDYESREAPIFFVPGAGSPLALFAPAAREMVGLTVFGLSYGDSSDALQTAYNLVASITTVSPDGPIRFVAFSGGAILLALVLRILKAAGRHQVLSIAFLDLTPTFYTTRDSTAQKSITCPDDASLEDLYVELLKSALDDPEPAFPSDVLNTLLHKRDAGPGRQSVESFQCKSRLYFNTLVTIGGDEEADATRINSALAEIFTNTDGSQPDALFIRQERGMRLLLPASTSSSFQEDFGLRLILPKAQVVDFEGSHFGQFGSSMKTVAGGTPSFKSAVPAALAQAIVGHFLRQ